MEVTVHIPDQVAADLSASNGDLSRKFLEAYALQAYQAGELTAHQVQELLSFESRLEVDAFFKAHGVRRDYTLEDLERERATADAIFGQ